MSASGKWRCWPAETREIERERRPLSGSSFRLGLAGGRRKGGGVELKKKKMEEEEEEEKGGGAVTSKAEGEVRVFNFSLSTVL
jgi:hypothetical protein